MMHIRSSLQKYSSAFILVLALTMPGCTEGDTGNNDRQSRWSVSQKLSAFINWMWAPKHGLEHDIQTIFSKENVVPLVVIGSGPAGLGAALYGARDNVDTLVIEGPEKGGLLMKTTLVENWPGATSIMGPKIMEDLDAQVRAAGARFLADIVTHVDLNQWPFLIQTEDNRTIHALSIVIATGAAPRRLGVPGEDDYWGLGGSGVSACAVCDAFFTRGKDVVVAGGGDSAIEEALQLANHAKSVTILVRKDEMRAAQSMQDRIKDHPIIKIVYNVEIKKIMGEKRTVQERGVGVDDVPGTWIGEEAHVTGIEVYNNKTQETYHMPIDAVFLAVGHIPNTELFKGQLAMDENGYITTMGRTQKTSVQGVSVAGEAQDNIYRQAGVSFGDGTKAALDQLAFLREIGFTREIAGRLNKLGQLWEDPATLELPSLSSMAELHEAFDKHDVVVLDFWAEDCSSCLHMLPIVGSIAKGLQGKAAFYKVDTKGEMDEVNELVTKFSIAKIPCMLVFKDGQMAARHAGPMSRQELEEFVGQFIQNS